MVTEKQKANLKPLNKRTKSEQREIAQMGGTASGVSRSIKAAFRAAGYDHLMAKVPDPRKRAALKKARLPPTYLGQLIFDTRQRAGTSAGMFESFCKALGITEPEQTNVIVNNNSCESPLKDFTKDELMQIVGLTGRKKGTGEKGENYRNAAGDESE